MENAPEMCAPLVGVHDFQRAELCIGLMLTCANPTTRIPWMGRVHEDTAV